MIYTILLSSLLAAATLSSALPSTGIAKRSTGVIKCPVVLSGLVSTSLTLSDFDSDSTSPFDAEYVRGSQLFSQTLLLPNVSNSHFDNSSYRAIETTINDQSIFQGQTGFRRIGLQMDGDTNTGSPGTTGIRTMHFSVKQDPARPMNLSHEYLNVWHETSDYSANQFNFEAGTIIGTSGTDKNSFKILNRENTEVWSTPIDDTAWQNFAVTLDFNQNTLQIYYSENDDPLKAVTSALSNDNSGEGQYQIGMLKKPTGTTNVVYDGYQESGINEGQIYGGLFVEDSTGGCISL
ncbi:hypothetical protein F5Y16DRAFT_88611 [Xylariaceae sp. FL0255]|nr:hypothetical protein F5Y16DRAFT_88611 [Xylariaceae sp. FL0255]